jgi:hypothetical protein
VTFDLPTLISLGHLEMVCYRDGFLIAPEASDTTDLGYDFVKPFYGDDIDGMKPYGFIAVSQDTGEPVAVFRGTEGAAEWIANANADLVQCPFFPPGCRTHHGFTRVYQTLRLLDGTPLKAALSELGPDLVFLGHSLGASEATLAAADLGAVALVTFASPRVGNDRFCSQAIDRIGTVLRLVNLDDLVPRVPISLFGNLFKYDHVGAPDSLDPNGQVADNLICQHHVTTYLHLLDPAQPLDAGCAGGELVSPHYMVVRGSVIGRPN